MVAGRSRTQPELKSPAGLAESQIKVEVTILEAGLEWHKLQLAESEVTDRPIQD